MRQLLNNLSKGKESEEDVFNAVFAGIRAVMFRGLTPLGTRVALTLLREMITDTLKELEDTADGAS